MCTNPSIVQGVEPTPPYSKYVRVAVRVAVCVAVCVAVRIAVRCEECVPIPALSKV